MVDRQRLLNDLKPLLKEVEADLRARCDEVPQIDADLKKEYEQARAADRTGVTYEEWRADLITQVAAAWLLSCVFVRFLEDNSLIAPPRISGPLHGAGTDAGLMRARDERETYFKTHAKQTDRDYLLNVFDGLATLPGTKDVFGSHNVALAYRNWLSGDAAQKLIEFFQKIDADGTGEIIHNFTDPNRGSQGGGWDTRFLGDLYQDLSEAARKKYALLQTPIFVEEFILDRTLEPAIKEFGLPGFKMIDPACGSGHFLLGSFARLLLRWRQHEPGTSDRELILRALSSVHGVDLNPFAIAIARFRLLIAVLRECRITKLKEAPAFAFNLVCGDSLLHGSPGQEQQLLGFHELSHAYQSEDLPELERILKPGGYHAVVANPPYIAVKDKALNQAYRDRYPEVCHRKYSLSVPFLQRLFVLACEGGFTGQITANSFMKREFGKKLIESYLPRIDLTHMIDTSKAYIPGHGTPTVILLGRNRLPVAPTVRAAMGITREKAQPIDPTQGKVWRAILDQIDNPNSQSAFLSVADTARASFHAHPWSVGGGGAAELKELIEAELETMEREPVDIGVLGICGMNDAMIADERIFRRCRVELNAWRALVIGDQIRDWGVHCESAVIFPYEDGRLLELYKYQALNRYLWPSRTVMGSRLTFGKQTYFQEGRPWWQWHQLTPERLRASRMATYSLVATHSQFSLASDRRWVFSHSALIIASNSQEDPNALGGLVGLLNSSVGSFWFRQVLHDKGGGGIGGGIAAEAWERFLEFDGTKIKSFPLPLARPLALARQLDALAQHLSTSLPAAVVREAVPTAALLAERRQAFHDTLAKLIALQEELDWQCYGLYGLLDDTATCATPPRIERGQRAFEIVLARKMAAGEEESTWFVRHGSTPITEIPKQWPEEYRALVQKRIDLIDTDANITLIERPEYKRRWNTEPWDEQQERALKGWLLDRLESYFDLDGRMSTSTSSGQATAWGELVEPRLTSVAKTADLARADKDFMQVAEIYAGRMDFDVAALVAELVSAECAPALPVLRYKTAALDKRKAWERTWDLQRLEDAVDAVFDIERLKKIAAGKAEEALRPVLAVLPIDETAKPQVLREAVNAAGHVAEAVKQKLNLDTETITKPIHEAVKRAKKAAVGDIAVPPKYTSADFLPGAYWRLRGKLDVPKERWVSFPHCEGEDGTLVIAWAGYDHLQLARSIAERYELAKENEGRKLVPLLAAIGQLVPWLKQWHNEIDAKFGTRMGDYFESYLAEEAKALGQSVEQVMAWTPPEKVKGRGRKKVSS